MHLAAALLAVMASSAATLKRALLIADLHADPSYQLQATAKCRCRSPCLNVSQPARRWGQPLCDAPYALIEATVAAAQKALPEPDLVLILGCMVAHHMGSRQASDAVFAEVTSELLPPAVANSRGGCAIALGNNDVFPDYAIRLADPTFYAQQAAAAARLCNLSAVEEASLAAGGYYARGARDGWPRILVLNTDIYTTRPSAPPLDVHAEPDPHGQMAWFEAELQAAVRERTQVLVIGHMPPCLDYYTRQPNWQRTYAQRYTSRS